MKIVESLSSGGALLVNTSFEAAIDEVAVYEALAAGKIRAFQDGVTHDKRFEQLPLSVWFNSAQTGYNTRRALKMTSDMATQSMINLLLHGKDQYIVNV